MKRARASLAQAARSAVGSHDSEWFAEVWDHPCDEFHRLLYKRERAKKSGAPFGGLETTQETQQQKQRELGPQLFIKRVLRCVLLRRLNVPCRKIDLEKLLGSRCQTGNNANHVQQPCQACVEQYILNQKYIRSMKMYEINVLFGTQLGGTRYCQKKTYNYITI